MKIKMRVATQSLISAQVANGGGAPVVELLLCQESGFCQNLNIEIATMYCEMTPILEKLISFQNLVIKN